MADEPYTVIDSGKDTMGTSWEIGVSDLGGLMVSSARRGLILHGEKRDRFAEAVARAVMPGQAAQAAGSEG
jgi:hypothetical protein